MNEETAQPKIGRIEVDKEKCISVASCVELAARTFHLDPDNKSEVADQRGDAARMQFEAARSCPARAIYVYDDTGKQIWPRLE